MYKIKFTPYRAKMGKIYHRQTTGYNLLSQDGRYKFYIDEDIEDPDFWVVQSKGLRKPETCRVARENTIFLSTEPRSVLVYPKKYISQFGTVFTCQEDTRHPNVQLGPAILPWHVGFTEDKEGNCAFSKDYDGMKSAAAPEKTKLLSIITSNKAFTSGHLKRLAFVEKLKEHYGDKLDVYGRGIKDFDDKWDILAPYKYHIAIENSSQDYYWTEKISDCYLTETFPLYYGCTNLNEYFPEKSFRRIDINNIEEAIRIIDDAIASDVYGKSRDVLHECKNLVLDDYNMFEYITRICDTLDPDRPKEMVTINPCKSMSDPTNFWNYTIGRNYYKLKQSLHDRLFGNIAEKLK